MWKKKEPIDNDSPDDPHPEVKPSIYQSRNPSDSVPDEAPHTFLAHHWVLKLVIVKIDSILWIVQNNRIKANGFSLNSILKIHILSIAATLMLEIKPVVTEENAPAKQDSSDKIELKHPIIRTIKTSHQLSKRRPYLEVTSTSVLLLIENLMIEIMK